MPRPVPAASARRPSAEEVEELSRKAFALERGIKTALVKGHEVWWELARHVHEFHEGGYWTHLGYTTLNDFLAQPDIGLSRTQFFRMSKMYDELVVTREIPEETLSECEPSKVQEVSRAIMAGKVEVEEALADAKTLGLRDLKREYGASNGAAPQKADGDHSLDAESEAALEQCPSCGTWVTADKIEREDAADGGDEQQ